MKLGMISPSHDAAGIQRIKALGLDYAEFDVNADDISYLNRAEIRKALSETGVKLGAVGRWGRDRITADGSICAKEQKDEFDLIDMCAELGCPVYITGCNYVDGLSYYQNVSAAIAYFQSLIDYAAGRVKLCVYNCSWNNYVNKPHEWDIINDHLKALGIKFDPSHTVNGGRDYLSEAALYGANFDHVHLKGTLNIDGRHIDDPPAGMDMINWGALLSILRKYNYQGMLSIEPHSATWQGELGEQGLKYTIDYFKKLLFIT
ncbi:MAG: sugar phosphate isomerase/epimerase family protein [Candidatus Woodwardiibium sp.]